MIIIDFLLPALWHLSHYTRVHYSVRPSHWELRKSFLPGKAVLILFLSWGKTEWLNTNCQVMQEIKDRNRIEQVIPQTSV